MCANGDNMDESMDNRKEKSGSSNRRSNKPLVEKRRRQRINECLNQLKSLVLQAMNKDSTQYFKLEKADILEMTVKHLKLIQRQHMSAAMASDPNVISKYRAGFNECAAEISRYLDSVNQSNPELKTRIMNYLANSMMQFPVIPVYQTVTSPVTSPYQFQMAPGGVPMHHGYLSQFCQDAAAAMATKANLFTSRDEEKHFAQSQSHGEHPRSTDSLRPPINPESTSRLSSSPVRQVPSPVRQIPSPCDSDSGLSDSSLSISHDENGNYSQFNINTSRCPQFKSEPSTRQSAGEISDFEYGHYGDNRRQCGSKRSRDFAEDLTSRKRQRTPESSYKSEPSHVAVHQVPEMSENMWRPW